MRGDVDINHVLMVRKSKGSMQPVHTTNHVLMVRKGKGSMQLVHTS